MGVQQIAIDLPRPRIAAQHGFVNQFQGALHRNGSCVGTIEDERLRVQTQGDCSSVLTSTKRFFRQRPCHLGNCQRVQICI